MQRLLLIRFVGEDQVALFDAFTEKVLDDRSNKTEMTKQLIGNYTKGE